MIRVLSTIVVPPHLTVSGGARAGELLSSALNRYCDVSIASMMNGEGVPVEAGADQATRIPVSSWLPPLVPWSRLSGRYRTLFYRSSLPHVIGRGTFDIVHIHNPMPALEMLRVARAARAARIPVVVSTHGFNEVARGHEIYGFGHARRLIWRELVQRPVSAVVREAAAVFALSEADFDIVRAMGYGGPNLSVVTNGVSLPAPHDPTDDARALMRLGIRPGTEQAITCMFLANHTPNKGLRVLLEAFAGLDCPFVLIVGGEQRPDIDYEQYVQRCKPGQRIIITGRLSDREVAAAFRCARVFVYPTLADTFPLVVLEAMSHGVPVIASRVGGIPHQIDDSCGLIVEPRDVDGLRAAITRLAGTPERLARMGDAARQRVAAHFSWDSAARAAIAGYRRALGLAPADIQPRRPVKHHATTGTRSA